MPKVFVKPELHKSDMNHDIPHKLMYTYQYCCRRCILDFIANIEQKHLR